MVINGITGRERERERERERNLHTTVIKESLSNYAQQDWPDVTKRSTSRHVKASSGKDS
jgi:hypothetical protein